MLALVHGTEFLPKMLLEKASEWFGWPESSSVLDPQGEGPRAISRQAKTKIGGSLKRRFPNTVVETGLLTPDPNGNATAAPLAIICQFPNGASEEALKEAHRLAWNFSQTAVLVTLEPHRLIAWSCFLDPSHDVEDLRVCETSGQELDSTDTKKQEEIRQLLHWVSLITGDLQKRVPEKFPSSGRADALLLKNLRYVRRELLATSLSREFCHDLLARVIFTQFLFHRKDRSGKPFFSSTLLQKRCDGQLKRVHENLETILRDKREAYSLFQWMDDRFNGDLFPGKAGQSATARKAAWRAEKQAVQQEHLDLIADLVAGAIDTTDGQLLLWPSYSFDTIPLEFISSVYEEFLNEDRNSSKAYYTSPHLVDYVLDAVLPWDGEDWNLKILDPACGSGIFLVKAFQRLIHRWRNTNDREPLVRDLKPMLANNFVGVDINPDAVRVACFSLYLAMADAIDPKHYVTREKVFPRLRGLKLLHSDFFREDLDGIRTLDDACSYDVVVGNAPWGRRSLNSTSDKVSEKTKKTHAQAWLENSDWTTPNYDIGPLFIAKSVSLCKKSNAGIVGMVQPAAVLYQRSKPAKKLREKLFSEFRFEEVTNLTLLRRELFSDAVSGACVLVLRNQKPAKDSDFAFVAPKHSGGVGTEITIDPQDVSRIDHKTARNSDTIWAVLTMGGWRDAKLIKKLSEFPTLKKLEKANKVSTRRGIIPGDKIVPEFKGRLYYEPANLPEGSLTELHVDDLGLPTDPRVHGLHGVKDLSAFKQPQLLVKLSYTKSGRFRAALVKRSKKSKQNWGVICRKAFLSVSDVETDEANIRAACLVFNSLVASYFVGNTGSRILFNQESLVEELLSVPLPTEPTMPSDLKSLSSIDKAIKRRFGLTKADWHLIEDFLAVSLPDALRNSGRRGAARTKRKKEPELSEFAATVKRVLKSNFGDSRKVKATVYQEPNNSDLLPVRMVTFELEGDDVEVISTIEAGGLLDSLRTFKENALVGRNCSAKTALGYQRVAYLVHKGGLRNSNRCFTVIKPDQYRYWTNSQAMRDADELSVALLNAAEARKG